MVQRKDIYPKGMLDEKDEELMKRFQADKDYSFFEVTYNRHFVPLSKYLFWLTGDMEKSKDIAQNIFIKILDNPNLFDTSKNFKVWLFAIAKNRWKNDIRDRSTKLKFEKKLKHVQPFHHEDSDDELNEERLQKVQTAINNLSENHREVIVLKYTNNFTIDEISDVLECSEGTVKSRLFYALKNLKKHTGI